MASLDTTSMEIEGEQQASPLVSLPITYDAVRYTCAPGSMETPSFMHVAFNVPAASAPVLVIVRVLDIHEHSVAFCAAGEDDVLSIPVGTPATGMFVALGHYPKPPVLEGTVE